RHRRPVRRGLSGFPGPLRIRVREPGDDRRARAYQILTFVEPVLGRTGAASAVRVRAGEERADGYWTFVDYAAAAAVHGGRDLDRRVGGVGGGGVGDRLGLGRRTDG